MPKKSNFSGLKQLTNNIEKLKGTSSVPLTDVLSDSFLKKNTPFISLSDLFQKGGFTVETREDLDAIPQESLDAFINSQTKYKNFGELQGAAGAEYFSNKLLKGL